MRTYADVFKNAQGAALIPFFVLGDPTPEASVELICAAVEAGADVLELGVPFSDPVADGPTIQRADIRSLEQGVNVNKAFELIHQVKQRHDTPIGLLMYYNLIVHYGVEKFYKDAAAAGVNSVLVADLCVDDADEVLKHNRNNGLDTVFMVTPNTSIARRQKIAQLCSGFIYTVSLLGVTGARTELSQAVLPLIKELKTLTKTPVCVGFGVSQPEHAATLAQAGADGVIVGSAVVSIIEKHLDNLPAARKELVDFIAKLKTACQR